MAERSTRKMLGWGVYIDDYYGNGTEVLGPDGVLYEVECMNEDTIYDDYYSVEALKELKQRLVTDYGTTHDGLQWLKANVFDTILNPFIAEKEEEERQEREYEEQRRRDQEERERERQAQADRDRLAREKAERERREREAEVEDARRVLREAEIVARAAKDDPDEAQAALAGLLAAQEHARSVGVV